MRIKKKQRKESNKHMIEPPHVYVLKNRNTSYIFKALLIQSYYILHANYNIFLNIKLQLLNPLVRREMGGD